MLHMLIPERELRFSFARSSGAGGQNVNKTSTKVQVRWSIYTSGVFSDEQKQRIRRKLASRINNRDELIVVSEESRSQLENRTRATARLQTLIAQAIQAPKKRRPTRPTRSSQEKRLQSKKYHSLIKTRRRQDE